LTSSSHTASHDDLAGEHASTVVWVTLLALGVVATIADIRLWLVWGSGRALQERVEPKQRPLAMPVITPLPLAPPPVSVPPPAAVPAVAAAAPPSDCAPLFPITFELNSAIPHFDPNALAGLVEWLLTHPDAILVVDGHADSLGSAVANFGLSQRRANQVAARFVAATIPKGRITRRAFGQYTPIVGTPDSSGRNRRVDLSIAGVANCPVSEAP
jgi:hypothetical protein